MVGGGREVMGRGGGGNARATKLWLRKYVFVVGGAGRKDEGAAPTVEDKVRRLGLLQRWQHLQHTHTHTHTHTREIRYTRGTLKGKGKGRVGRAGERENERQGSDGRDTAGGSRESRGWGWGWPWHGAKARE